MYTQSTASLEYVRVPVGAKSAGQPVNPTTDTVAMAFLAGPADPTSGDWKTAGWDTDASTYPPTYYAQCLVGPSGTVTLAVGTYSVWVKVTDNPETPVKRAGQIKIF